MKCNRGYAACLFFCLLFGAASAQNNKTVDSLFNALRQYDLKRKTPPELRDTVKVGILSNLSATLYGLDNKKALIYANKQLALSKEINYPWGMANALNTKASIYDYNGNYDWALILYQQSLSKYIESGDKSFTCDVCNNIGVLYTKKGIYTEALKYMLRAVDIAEDAHLPVIVMGTYNNIGILYTSQGKDDMALKYYLLCLWMQKKYKSNYISITYMNVGELYRKKQQFSKAMYYLDLGLKYALKEQNYESIANNTAGIARIYAHHKQYNKAIEKLMEALAIREKRGDVSGMFGSYLNLGAIYLNTGHNDKALSYTQKALAIVDGSRELSPLAETYAQLSEVYERAGNFELAYKNHLLFKTYNDSVFNQENEKKLVEQQMNFDFKNIQEKKDLLAKEALQRQKNIRNMGFIGSGLAAFFVVFGLVRRHKRISLRKQKAYNEGMNELQEELSVKEIESQMLKTENENIQLKNDLMQEKLEFNQRELASSTLYLFEKNKMLSELRNELDALPKSIVTGSEIENIKSTIQRNFFLDADWEKFRLHFEQVHPNFFNGLNEKHPGLTAYEVRLCAYLHMKLATKEIAALLNITPDSVFKAKMRLNKKLNAAGGDLERILPDV